MSTTRATNARHVRQRKLNTKQGLRIIRETEIEDQHDESQQHIPQVETGVEKGEEIEYHLQAVINASNAAALGAKQVEQNYIPTPEASKATGVHYDELYPKVFKDPATYIKFSSTVEDCNPISYCMDDEDVKFLAQLNEGKDEDGQERKGAEKLSQCNEDVFEEVMNFFEESSARLQPFANVDNAPILTLEEMEQSLQEEQTISAEAQKWLKPIYKHWVVQKGSRPLMPSIKVRVLDTTNEADDADPYVCFRRREVRQTRKTRGRDAQVAEKLKKLRLELEDGRQLLLMVNQREKLKSQQAQLDRKKFRGRHQLRKVKVDKQIVGEKGDDEELLVDQKPVTKPSKRQSEAAGNRPATIRLRSVGERAASVANAPDNDLPLLEDYVSEGAAFVQNTIEARKEQHKKWNQHWVDETKLPLTPPFEEEDPMLKWASFPPEDLLNSSYPTPPPSLPSRSSIEGEDVDMKDAPRPEAQIGAVGGAEREPEIFAIPGAWPESEDEHGLDPFPAVRLRIGRGGRRWLETRKRKPRGQLSSGVVSDDDSDDDYAPDYFPVPERITFEYRAALNNRPTARPEGPSSEQRQRQWSGDQQQGGANGHAHPQAQQAVAVGGPS
ncbi:hypothetical protein KC368_g10094 [Hortaea werneckii]|nr:hypothetical protein KC368_g10094 [Hortaea werneckii]